MDPYPSQENVCFYPTKPQGQPKSPPMAFQISSNDALIAPRNDLFASAASPFQPSSYLSSTPFQSTNGYEVTSPMEHDLEGQVRRQAEALRLQHQAFVIERECWEMERERLYKRIASLEGLLKSPQAHSPARSPVNSPFANGTSFSASQQHSSNTGTCSRLPSIAEDDLSPDTNERRSPSIKRDGAPSHIDLPQDEGDVRVAFEDAPAAMDGTEDIDDPASPPTSRQVLSPPPASYRMDAGHTPLRLPSRPTSSDSPTRKTLLYPGSDDTPTRRNTHKNISIEEEEDNQSLIGPLRLPELPHMPGEENFTMDALTARLQYITEHPDENEPLALRARVNKDEADETEDRTLTLKMSSQGSEGPKEDGLQSHDDASGPEMSPPPASAVSQTAMSPEEYHERGGIRLKKKTSTNFGAPFGQLRP